MTTVGYQVAADPPFYQQKDVNFSRSIVKFFVWKNGKTFWSSFSITLAN